MAFRLSVLFVFVFLFACNQQKDISSDEKNPNEGNTDVDIFVNFTRDSDSTLSNMAGRGAMLLTRFKSYEQLKSVIRIQHLKEFSFSSPPLYKTPIVRLSHQSCGHEVVSVLGVAVNENDFLKAKNGGLWPKLSVLMKSPYGVIQRKDLWRVFGLARTMEDTFGEGSFAFYHIAEAMQNNISAEDKANMPAADISEKGYLNTFNHVSSQAFVTSIFSERLADFIADIHERINMPELISGEFTEEQIADIENGPTDNYVDMINNQWGQELGKVLKEKYNIDRHTEWTPELMENYLNDMQRYYSWSFKIGFKPFRATDDIVIRFTKKINRVLRDIPGVR